MSKISAYSELGGTPDVLDEFVIVDKSDTSMSASGTTKKVQAQYLTISDASTTVKGKVELATDAETITGTDTVRSVTPANITAKIDTDGTLAGNLDTRIPSQKAVKTYVDAQGGNTAPQNLLKNGNFINNSTNGYGSTPDDWTSSNANPVQGGIPALTKQNLIDGIGVVTGDIEGLWPCNGFVNTDDIDDLSDNAYDLDTAGNVPGTSSDGLMGTALDFESGSSQYGSIADASCPNLEISGSQTFFAFVKAESFGDFVIMAKGGGATSHQLYVNSTGNLRVNFDGLSTTTTLTSDVIMQTGKWYFVVGVYDSANTKLKVWVNGIKKEATASGSASDTNGPFRIGANSAGLYWDGLIQNAGVLSVALTDNQVKKLFAMTMYKGQKIRRSTTNAYAYQQLPQDLVERLRGKTVALRADLYQGVASTAQISIYQTMADATTDETIISATDATTGSWLSKVATGTLEADVVTVEIRIKHSTSDGNTWFKNVSLYEGSTLLPYDHSKDDWSRFPNLLNMRIPNILSGYQYEEKRLHTSPITPSMRASGSMTVSSTIFSIKKFSLSGESVQFLMTAAFTNGGTASVANYYTLPFVCDSTAASAAWGHAVQVVNNSVQEVGVARLSSNQEIECYRYTGGNWALVANQVIHESCVFPLLYS